MGITLFVILMYLRDQGLMMREKFVWVQNKCFKCCLASKCCRTCSHACYKCSGERCRCCEKLTEAEHEATIVEHLTKAGMGGANTLLTRKKTQIKRTQDAESLNKLLTEHMDEDTVWFRPEKFKILLSFLQVFQEYRRTYQIKWPQKVQDYMDFF